MSRFVPAHRIVGSEDAPATVMLLHGALGSGRNWATFARALVRRMGRARVVLVDLRGHGESHGAPPPHTLAACAGDLGRLSDEVGDPATLVGHSLGGAVALYAVARGHIRPRQVWALDTPPGPSSMPSRSREELAVLMAALRAIPQPLARREEMTAALRDRGFGERVAAWMTTNLRRTPSGFVWRPDLGVVEALLESSLAEDGWPWLEAGAPGDAEVHLVRAARSGHWTAEAVARLEALPPAVRVHVLPRAGHWVHVDDPGGLIALLVGGVPTGG